MSLALRLLSLSVLAVAAPSVSAETLEITGELMTSTCSVGSTGGTITVPMGKVDLASVNASTRAGQKNFTIALDCSGSGASQDVGVRFGGTPDGSTGNLALTAASSAANVGVALYDAARHLRTAPVGVTAANRSRIGVLFQSAGHSAQAQRCQ